MQALKMLLPTAGAVSFLSPAMGLSTFAIGAAVASSLAWAGFDAARKGLSARISTAPLVIVLMIGQCPVFIA